MAIKILEKISENDACLELKYKPQILKIKFISKIKPSSLGDDRYYFFINYEMEDGRKFGVSYVFDKEDDYYTCKSRSKLFNLVKGFLDIDETTSNGIGFTRDDLMKLLLNKKFLATAEFREIYGNTFPYICVVNVL